jgi:hypothetical protein
MSFTRIHRINGLEEKLPEVIPKEFRKQLKGGFPGLSRLRAY